MNQIIIPTDNPLFNKLCLLIETRSWLNIQDFLKKNSNDKSRYRKRQVELDFKNKLEYINRHVVGIVYGRHYRKKIMNMREYPFLSDKEPTHVRLLDGWGLEFDEGDGSLIFFEKEKH